jgi:hypothetical protein
VLTNNRAKAIRKAAAVANFNGWVTAIIAALSAPFAPFSVAGFLLTCGLAVVAYNEFRGRKLLLSYNPSAARLLGWNQLGFLAMICVYCVWMMLTSASSFAAELQAHPELEDAIGSLDGFDAIFRTAVIAFYGAVMVLSVIFQGLNALYYFTRRKHVDMYLQQTPEHVREIARIAAAT